MYLWNKSIWGCPYAYNKTAQQKLPMPNTDFILTKLFEILETFQSQNPQLYLHLKEVMKNQWIQYNENTPIFCAGETVDKAMFIAEGFITRSGLNPKGNPKILSIYEVNEIKAGPDFIDQSPSEFVIEAIAGTLIIYIKYTQLKQVCQRFPETRELFELILSDQNRKELRLKKLFSLKGIDQVEAFFKRYPKMLKPNTGLTNEKIASYLNIGVSTLIEHKTTLISLGRLPNPTSL